MLKDYYIYLKMLFLIIIMIALFILFNQFNIAFNDKKKLLLILSYLIFSIGVIYNKKISFIGYLLALLVILFYRHQNDNNYTDYKYIVIWIKHLFSNKIIFINVFGNFILYIPFVYYLNEITKRIALSIIFVFIFIIFGEYVQYLLKIGVFDVVDIVINTLGVLIYGLIYEVYIWMRKKRIQKKKIQI